MRPFVAGIAFFVAFSAAAQVQVTVQRDGKKVITNFGGVGGRGRTSDFVWLAKQRNRRSKYDPIIERRCDQFGVDPVLVRAVIQVESNFDPHSISRRGARGLMQLMPETAQRYGVQHVFDPEENIRGGVHYLADLIQMFPHDLPRTLAAYNAGENAVLKYAGIPPYDETMTYVKRALTVYYGAPYGQATWFAAPKDGRKLAGGFGAGFVAQTLLSVPHRQECRCHTTFLTPIAALPGMRYLGTH